MDERWFQILQQLVDEDVLVLIILGGVAIAAIAFTSISSMVKSTARERTRREIAAYIAEGTMTPEQGERLMRSGETED
ncbi:MAG: hypothetical protein KF866_10440 [Phycisphaeraceae bacterium]|nr:hypothetical protein [Phycisphaeraceae bacterium]MCW5754920.1 hypothetical protein [Phycisphaeraceae bacterium]